MLVVRVLATEVINDQVILNEIDEIYIQNTGHTLDGTAGEWHVYQIKKPNIVDTVLHRRKDGYRPLVQKALKLIEKHR